MAKANLCKCTNCDTIMIDQNSQVDATLHELTGKEVEMQYMQGLIEHGGTHYYWVCPICETDEYLIDL